MTLTPSPSESPSVAALRDLRAASCGPVGAPTVTADLSENIILTSLDDLHNWARLSSLWPLLYGTACCFIEFAALLGSRFDFDRFGLVPRSSPRQADLLIVAGTVTMKMGPALVRLYEQMPEPKYVIAMGACTITGGMFSADSTTAFFDAPSRSTRLYDWQYRGERRHPDAHSSAITQPIRFHPGP